MVDVARQLLDELMGRNRNQNPGAEATMHWSDPEFCPYYLVKLCPHDLFTNTRVDLGSCSRVHDDEVKNQFATSSPCYKKQKVVDEFFRFCHQLIADVDRRIFKGRQRLQLMNSKLDASSAIAKRQEVINELEEKIVKLMREVEEAGSRGDVDQAQALMKSCDLLNVERDALRAEATREAAAAQEKQMEVCEVCGAFLIVGDVQQRIDDHLCGKQHLGYLQIRKSIENEEELRKKELNCSLKKHDSEDRERERERDRDRDRDRRDEPSSKKQYTDRDNSSESSRRHHYDRDQRDRSKRHDHYSRYSQKRSSRDPRYSKRRSRSR